MSIKSLQRHSIIRQGWKAFHARRHPGLLGTIQILKNVLIRKKVFRVLLLQLEAEGGRHREASSFKPHIPLRLTCTRPDTQVPEDPSGGGGSSQGFGSGCAPGKRLGLGGGGSGGGLRPSCSSTAPA